MKLTLDGLSVEGIKTALQLLDERVGELLEKDWLRKAANLSKWRVEAAAGVSKKMHTALQEAAAEGRKKASDHCGYHYWKILSTSADNIGNSYQVMICRDCGRFKVSGTVGGQKETLPFNVEFCLSTPDTVEAAGRFLHLIETEETKEL